MNQMTLNQNPETPGLERRLRAVAQSQACTQPLSRAVREPEDVLPPADAHSAAVVACAVLDGSPLTALTADAAGRLMHHNVAAYLSILGASGPHL